MCALLIQLKYQNKIRGFDEKSFVEYTKSQHLHNFFKTDIGMLKLPFRVQTMLDFTIIASLYVKTNRNLGFAILRVNKLSLKVYAASCKI